MRFIGKISNRPSTGTIYARMEIPPGPVYRIILGELRDAWIDERITNSVEEQALIEVLLHKHTHKNQDE